VSADHPITADAADPADTAIAADMADSDDAAITAIASDPVADGRRLFRYLAAEEWRDYRAILGVFADTFFAEYSPEEVAVAAADAGRSIDPELVPVRLEQLARWGNLTVSSAVGNPASVADYYRRRSRYLITRGGQEVFDLVEGVLARVDTVRDVSTSRLRELAAALERLRTLMEADSDSAQIGDVVGAVFDNHAAFTEEITAFFAALNQWQARYDLSPEEFRLFAEVLVGYVSDRLAEIDRTSRPIGASLGLLDPVIPAIVRRMDKGLAARVEGAGLSGVVSVSQRRGATLADWEHLGEWFRASATGPSRIDRLTGDAVAAIRTLTANLTRLSRIGAAASSRRGDFLRLARWFHRSESAEACHTLANSAFGMFPARHWGAESADFGDPVGVQTSWWNAPRAPVAVALRERGETKNRGAASPMPDRRIAVELLRRRRAAEAAELAQVEAELAALADRPEGIVDGAQLSVKALGALEDLIAKARAAEPVEGVRRSGTSAVECAVQSAQGNTLVISPAGTLCLLATAVRIARRPEDLDR
jgi:uncharacterized protein (TIGR02677 family)